MNARTARWVAGRVAAGSVTLTIAGLALAHADRYLVPASLTGWTISNVSSQLVNVAVPVRGGAVVPAVVFAGSIWVNSAAANVVQSLAFLCLWTAIAIAVLKYRLYEIAGSSPGRSPMRSSPACWSACTRAWSC